MENQNQRVEPPAAAVRWETPPPAAFRPRLNKRATAATFVAGVKTEPGKWALYRHGFKTRFSPKDYEGRYPGMEFAGAEQADGTWSAWGRWIGEAT